MYCVCRHALWPSGLKAEPRQARDEATQMRTRVAAKVALLCSLSGDNKTPYFCQYYRIISFSKYIVNGYVSARRGTGHDFAPHIFSIILYFVVIIFYHSAFSLFCFR